MRLCSRFQSVLLDEKGRCWSLNGIYKYHEELVYVRVYGLNSIGLREQILKLYAPQRSFNNFKPYPLVVGIDHLKNPILKHHSVRCL
jgi:hypothetical protein